MTFSNIIVMVFQTSFSLIPQKYKEEMEKARAKALLSNDHLVSILYSLCTTIIHQLEQS